MSEAATVFVVDDDAAIRKTLFTLLRSVGLAVETYASGQAFLSAYVPGRPGCLVLDLRMPGMSGLEVQQRLAELDPGLPVLFLTGYGEVATAVLALRQGAVDFLEKPFSTQHLLDRIHHALERDTEARQAFARHQETAGRLALLTAGERAVLDLMVAGKAYKEIAKELAVSYKTVEARRARVMKKMQCESLPQLLSTILTDRFWVESRQRAAGR